LYYEKKQQTPQEEHFDAFKMPQITSEHLPSLHLATEDCINDKAKFNSPQ